MTKGIGRLFVAAMALLLLSGCGPDFVNAVTSIELVAHDLDTAQDEWQELLKTLQRDLTKDLQGTMATEVDLVIQRALNGARMQAFCGYDFLARRISVSLTRLKQSLIPGSDPPQLLAPAVCTAVPSVINGYLSPERRYVADVHGYDLQDFSGEGLLTLWLVADLREPEDVSHALSVVSPYHATINLGANGVPLTSESLKIEVRAGGDLLSTLSVIQPYDPEPVSEPVALGKRTWVPPFVRMTTKPTDCDFHGHGPCITTGAEARLVGQNLETRLYMKAYECHPNNASQYNHTTVKGWSPWQVSKTFPPETVPLKIISPASSSAPLYRDNKRDEDHVVHMGNGDLVAWYKTVGDTSGDDCGATSVEANFNKVLVQVQPPKASGFLSTADWEELKKSRLEEYASEVRDAPSAEAAPTPDGEEGTGEA